MRDNYKDLHDLLHRVGNGDALALAQLDVAIRGIDRKRIEEMMLDLRQNRA